MNESIEQAQPSEVTNAATSMIPSTQALKELADLWGIEPKDDALPVIGKLEKRGHGEKPYWVLVNVRHPQTSQTLEYPADAGESLADRGVYIAPSYTKSLIESKSGSDLYVLTRVELSEQKERNKRNNPYLLKVKNYSAEWLASLPLPDEIDLLEFDNQAWVLQSVYASALNQLASPLEKERESLNGMLNELKAARQQEQQQLQQTQEQVAQSQEQVDECRAWLSTFEEQERIMSAKFERLEQYLKDKADLMLALAFIDEEEHALLTRTNPTRKQAEDSVERLDFHKDLNGDYRRAVTWLQAWMVDQGILYQRHVLENFLALIQTHDLIVLAGDSGSGKTSLVKAFAEATGSECRIIPVKPNWTSSEDLLGYFNPLEQKFQPTPFLNALLEAKQQPEKLFLICLDEMNLARVEYYFADFLSLLEERNKPVEIELYADTQSGHVLAELRQVITALNSAAVSEDITLERGFEQILQSEPLSQKVRQFLGLAEGASLLEQQGRIRKMLASVLSTPASLTFPDNVRIIGAINVDETTNYLSPKILDRAHIIKFGSPLKQDWQAIKQDVTQRREQEEIPPADKPLHFEPEALGRRAPYPGFSYEDDFCQFMSQLGSFYLEPLGVEFGMRAIRQGLNYRTSALDAGMTEHQLRNHFIANKILPRLMLDGNQAALYGGNREFVQRLEILRQMGLYLKGQLPAEGIGGIHVSDEIERIFIRANGLDGIVNYWS